MLQQILDAAVKTPSARLLVCCGDVPACWAARTTLERLCAERGLVIVHDADMPADLTDQLPGRVIVLRFAEARMASYIVLLDALPTQRDISLVARADAVYISPAAARLPGMQRLNDLAAAVCTPILGAPPPNPRIE